MNLVSDNALDAVEVQLPDPDSGPTILPIAYHKAGSVLFDGIIKRLCAFSGRPYVNLERALFNKGYLTEHFQAALTACFAPSGIVNGVHRTYITAFENPPMDSVQRIFLVRDPRDVIVSYYFSLKTSHFVPPQGQTREGVLGARAVYESASLNESIMARQFQHVFHNMTRIARMIDRANSGFVVFRYEDIIFAKRPWIESLCELLGVTVTPPQMDRLLAEFDVVPQQENEAAHIRRVTPGDYRDKLKPDALAFIMREHEELFALLGYA